MILRCGGVGLALLLGASGCPGPIPGVCLLSTGHLCIQGEATTLSLSRATSYLIEVRAGAGCPDLESAPTSAASALAECQTPVAGCAISKREGPIAELPRLVTAGAFSADIDLGNHSGPFLVLVTLFAGSECVAHARGPLPAPAEQINLRLSDCSGFVPSCAAHKDCGGATGSGLCCRGLCVPPPPPPVAGMSFVPAGAASFGDTNPGALPELKACPEGGASRVSLVTTPFFMDQREATVASYRACVAQGACPPPTAGNGMNNCTYADNGGDTLAINCLTSAQAEAYCQHRTGQPKSLPHEFEWEWVAGRGQSRYPWSSGMDAGVTCEDSNAQANRNDDLGVCPRRGVLAPGSVPRDQTPPGPWPQPPLFDLGGNVAEWVQDRDGLMSWFDRCMLQPQNPFRDDGDAQVYRGGGWHSPAAYLKSTARRKLSFDTAKQLTRLDALDEIGVRCVYRLPGR